MADPCKKIVLIHEIRRSPVAVGSLSPIIYILFTGVSSTVGENRVCDFQRDLIIQVGCIQVGEIPQ